MKTKVTAKSFGPAMPVHDTIEPVVKHSGGGKRFSFLNGVWFSEELRYEIFLISPYSGGGWAEDIGHIESIYPIFPIDFLLAAEKIGQNLVEKDNDEWFTYKGSFSCDTVFRLFRKDGKDGMVCMETNIK